VIGEGKPFCPERLLRAGGGFFFRGPPTHKTVFHFFFFSPPPPLFKALVATDRQHLQDRITPCLRLYSTLWLMASRCGYITCTAYRFIDLVFYVKLLIWHMTAVLLLTTTTTTIIIIIIIIIVIIASL